MRAQRITMTLLLTSALLPACGGEEFDAAAATTGAGGAGGAPGPTATATATSSSTSSSSGGGGAGGSTGDCDPGEIRDCYTGPAGTDGVGPCLHGTQTCTQASVWGACAGEVLPGAEDCATGADEDCDGEANQAAAGCVCSPGEVAGCYEGPAGTEGVGACAAGTATCDPSGTAWGSCDGQVLPSAEICAELGDEDCDGVGCSDPLWGAIFGDASQQYPGAVAVDDAGNVYLAGGFTGALSLGGATLISAGSHDAFLAKLDASGAHVWSQQFGDSSYQAATGLAIDPQGNVLLVGAFLGSITFDAVHTSADSNAFVAKLGSDGAPIWSKSYGFSGDQDVAAIAVDANGDAIITGSFAGDLSPCFNPPCAWSSKGGKDIFLAKLAGAGGASIWWKYFGDADQQTAAAVAVDPLGNVAITGKHAGTMNFTSGLPGTPCEGADAFVARFDAMGNHSWSKRFGDPSLQEGTSIAMDGAGSVVVAGVNAGTIDLGAGSSVVSGINDGFVVKLNAAGTHLWSKTLASSGADGGRAVAFDPQGDVVVAGTHSAGIDLGGGLLPVDSVADIFIAKLEAATGAHVWSKDFGITGSHAANALATAPGGEIVLAGTTSGTIDLGGGPLASMGQTDILVVELGP